MAPKKLPPKPTVPARTMTLTEDIQYLSEDATSPPPSPTHGGEAAVPSAKPRPNPEDAFGPPPPHDDALGPHPPEDALGPPQSADAADNDSIADDAAFVQQLLAAEDAAFVQQLLERESAAELAALTEQQNAPAHKAAAIASERERALELAAFLNEATVARRAALQVAAAQLRAASMQPQAPATPLQPPAVQPQAPPAPLAVAPAPPQDALGQILLMLQQQRDDTEALKLELARQRGQAKQQNVKHAAEAHLRAMVAQDVAARGRVMPIGAYVPAGIVSDPAVPNTPIKPTITLLKPQVSRSSQAEEQPAPKTATLDPGARKAAAEGFDARHAPPTQKLPPPKKTRAVTPPIPDNETYQVNSDEEVSVLPPPTNNKPNASTQRVPEHVPKAKQAHAPLPMPPPQPRPPASPRKRARPAFEQLDEIVTKGWSKEQAQEAFEAVGEEGDQKEHVEEAVLWALNRWPVTRWHPEVDRMKN